MKEFLNMGGYALYVWGSYGIATVLLIVNVLVPMARHRQLMSRRARQTRRQVKRP